MTLVDVPGVGLRFVEVTEQAEAEIAAQRAAEAEVGALGGAFVFVLRGVHIGVPGAVPLIAGFFGDDIHHAAGGAVAVAGGGRAANHFDTFDHLRWHPAGIAAGVALAAPAKAHGVAAGDRLAVDQDQGIFRAHAADINLAVVAALAAGGVAGQVDPRHGANDLRDVARRGAFADLIGGDGGDARRLQVLLGGGDHHGLFSGAVFIVGGGFRCA